MCAEWNKFSVYLGVQKHVRDDLTEKSRSTSEAIRSDFEDAKLVINDPSSSNSVQTRSQYMNSSHVSLSPPPHQ